nr:MAG TPA: hypothetical protein [Caudoviricetes sp.]
MNCPAVNRISVNLYPWDNLPEPSAACKQTT